ncbi:UNVERIFIED_CONTAM: hypothetical protein O8I53_07595 [Campylobacter lari]
MLDVTVKFTDLNDVDKISREINELIDASNITLDFDFLTIHSPGFKTEYEFDELNEHLEEMLSVELIKNVNKMNIYIGQLIEFNKDFIIIR